MSLRACSGASARGLAKSDRLVVGPSGIDGWLYDDSIRNEEGGLVVEREVSRCPVLCVGERRVLA